MSSVLSPHSLLNPQHPPPHPTAGRCSQRACPLPSPPGPTGLLVLAVLPLPQHLVRLTMPRPLEMFFLCPPGQSCPVSFLDAVLTSGFGPPASFYGSCPRGALATCSQHLTAGLLPFAFSWFSGSVLLKSVYLSSSSFYQSPVCLPCILVTLTLSPPQPVISVCHPCHLS